MKATVASLALVIVFCGQAIAQEPKGYTFQVGPPMEGHVFRGPNGPFIRAIGPGKFWKDSDLMKKIGVSDEQVQRIDKIFRDHRLELIDLHAALDKQEAILEPLVEDDQPEEAQVIAQIDKVAQARANLEKSNARMLLAIRRVLTVDQWKKLRDLPGVNQFHTGPEIRMSAPGPAAPMPPVSRPPTMPPPHE
jgi:Spy/CpxP family protein refolding chaperone